MAKLIKTLSRNKLFYAFLILILIMFPSTFYMQSDKDNTMIVTTLGIDKKEDKLSISALAVIPNSSQEISAKLEVFEGEGKSIDEALEKISQNTGKDIGLAHCDCILISKDLTQDNITTYLDYFIRGSNLTTYATIVVADGKAKDLIEATKSSNDYLDLSLKEIVTFQEQRSILNNTNIEEFYRKYLSIGSTYYLPILSAEEGESSAQGSSGEKQEQSSNKKITNDNKLAVFKHGKMIRELTQEENFIYNLLSPSSSFASIKLSDINDNFVTDSTEIFKQKLKLAIPTYTFKENKPTVTFNIFLSLEINEIIGEDFSYASINSSQSFQSDIVKDKIHKIVDSRLKKTVELMKEDKIDVLDLHTKFNAFRPNKWKEYLKTLENPSDFLDNVDIKINLKIINLP